MVSTQRLNGYCGEWFNQPRRTIKIQSIPFKIYRKVGYKRYFPQRVISVTGSPQKNGAELYENTLQSIHRMKTNEDPPSVSKNSFCNDGVAVQTSPADDANNDNSGRAVHCQSFEMSSALSYSGLAINNSRTLEARINFVAPAGPQVIDAWICYVKLAKCNQLRAIIKE